MLAQAPSLRRRPRARVLIVGSGDVAARALPALLRRARVFALVRRPEAAVAWRTAGAIPLRGDLDHWRSLRRLAGLAPKILHLAPPPERGHHDPRTRRLLAALALRGPRAPRIVYIGTSGVYGNCAGARVAETRPLKPATPRAARRADAERQLRRAASRQTHVAILRAPGIYAADRLPLARLQRGDPVLQRDDDVFTNHIHADDLARLAVAALSRGGNGRCYNASDNSALRMGDYFDQVADAFALPRPPRLSRAAIAEQLNPLTLSFMAESRRLDNTRLRELRTPLRYPTIADGLAAALTPAAKPEPR